MKKVIATMIVGLFASAAFAQQQAPAPASKEVKAEAKAEVKQEVKQEIQKPAAEKK
ncbi:hypothetical protein [Pseudoduganella sp. OTU4001]|uniref:hypothetical protein n=1 Tax=Pseudoduganella sp. OTU4001 TaxID=3043854 RepID=UPI00313AFF80